MDWWLSYLVNEGQSATLASNLVAFGTGFVVALGGWVVVRLVTGSWTHPN